MGTSEKTDELFDVAVFEISTRIIQSFAGRNLRRDSGFHNADKRLDTVHERLNDDYSAVIVEAGQYKVGDVLA